ncbi:MAG: hypothetical protein WEB58_22800 [Planctomycetaceae bacterium]
MSHPQPVSAEWDVILTTFSRANEMYDRWEREGQLSTRVRQQICESLEQRLATLRELAERNADIPDIPAMLPLQYNEVPPVRALRLWRFLMRDVSQHTVKGVLTLAQSHALKQECSERLGSLNRQLLQEGITLAEPQPKATPPSEASAWGRRDVHAEQTSAQASATETVSSTMPLTMDHAVDGDDASSADRPSRPNLLEIILDPRSIQWLMGLGGALMVVGIVILLWVNEYFSPPVLALVMGVANVVVLAGGWSIMLLSRYQLVGKGLTLLACLVMPLNMWYYHTHDLVTIDGHLWVVAVIISALYAASARVLKDELFVYVFNLGVVMTGMLILADLPPSPQKFWEIASPATLLVILGLLGIHIERAFEEGDGPFARRRFGRAFFLSGHAIMISGLLMVFVAQLAGDWLYESWFRSIYQSFGAVPSPMAGELRWLGLLLVLAGLYASVYSDVVVKRYGSFIHVAAALLLWAEILIVQLLNLELGVDAIIVVLAITSLVINLTQASVTRGKELTRSIPLFGLLLGILPILMGLSEYFRYLGFREVWVGEEPRWTYVGAMALTAVSSRIGAHLYGNSHRWLSTAYFFAAAAASMVGAVAALAAMGLNSWEEHAPIMMLIPIAYLAASHLYGDRTPAKPLMYVAHAATAVMLASSLTSAFAGFTHIVEGQRLNLSLSLFFLEAAIFYGMATAFQKRPAYVHWAAAMAIGSLWQLMTYFGVSADTYLLSFALMGLGLLLTYRFSIIERTAAAPLADAAFMSANTLLSLSFVASLFRGLSRLEGPVHGGSGGVNWWFLGFSAIMMCIALLAVAIVRLSAWRRWYVVNSIAQGALILLALHKLSDLSPWQQVELFCIVIGLFLLAVGHVGWNRERDRESELVTTSLFFGSLLAVVPLAIATWYDRGRGEFLILNEAGFLFVSVLLLGSGLIFQLKATTVVGSAATSLYFLTLLIFVPWSQLSTIALLITIGGGTLFGTGLVLAFFRDRLLTLPDRFTRREGVFKVLNWR